MAAKDLLVGMNDDEAFEHPTDPPRKRRKQPSLPVDDDGEHSGRTQVVVGSVPRLVVSTPFDDEEDDDYPVSAPLRARRRPRAEHASLPPMSAVPSPVPRKKPKKKAAARHSAASDRFAHLPLEIAGVVLFALGVLVLLSLLSYGSMDAAAGRTAPVANWIGPGGAVLADLLTLIAGVAAFLAPLGLFLASMLCFRPVAQPRYAVLRSFGGLAGVLAVMTLLHLAFRGSTTLPFPAGGLIGAVIAEAGSRTLAPLGTGVIAIAITFVGFLLAVDRPVGPTTLGLADKLVQLAHRARESLAVWREERRLLLEEEDRLRREIDEENSEQQDARPAAAATNAAATNAAAENAEKRRVRIKDQAERRAKQRIIDDRPISLAPVGVSRPPLDVTARPEAAATIIDPASDPPWALSNGGPAGEPVVDGKRVSLQRVLAGAVRAPPAAAVATDDDGGDDSDDDAVAALHMDGGDLDLDRDDGALRIVERKPVDAEAVVAAADPVMDVSRQAFQLPPLNLLDYDAPTPQPIDEVKMRAQADKLIAKFRDFGIDGRIREIRPGPVVTTYEYVPAPGIKVSKIAALADDIAMAMEAIHVRIVAPIPGKGAIGIEIPNEKRETVYMKEIIADEAFKKSTDKLMMALGKDIEGRSYYANLAEMPHVLIAGTTGSGKSVSVNAMICSILYRATPEDVKFLMIDPKMLELSIYEGIPHLLLPPIIDSKKAGLALKWAVGEMERRYQLMSELGVRDMAGFNARVKGALDLTDPEARKILSAALKGRPIEKLPYIVIVVDEYADLLAVAGKDVEGYIMRIAQKARAAGLHVMLATQRPSVDVITGVIKANFPVRMGFRLASNHDSKTIINRPGAEKLLGRGDMLFMPPGTSNVSRVHGAFISEKELHRVVEFLKNQSKPTYDMSILVEPEGEEGEAGEVIDEPKDVRYDEAVAVVARTRKCSTSWLQRSMNLGYQRAARIVDRMEREGLVGAAQNAKGDREIFVKPDALPPPS